MLKGRELSEDDEERSTVGLDSLFHVDLRDKLTRKVRWEQLDEEFAYDPNQLDRAVVALDQIRTLVRTFRDKLFTEIFPGRTQVPKTLIFAKDDSHAEDDRQDRPRRIRQGNEFAEKITYRTTDASASPWKRFIKCKTTAQIPVRAVIAPRSSSSCTTATARASPPPQVSSPYASKGPNSMPASPSKLRLPQIEKVKLRRFSLFTANPDKHARRARGVKVPFTHGND